MEIEYMLNEADVIAYWEYHADHSPSTQRFRQRERFGTALALLLTGSVITITQQGPLAILVFAVAAMIWILVTPTYLRWHHRRRAKELIREGSDRLILGKHRLSIEPDGLRETSNYNETKTRWFAIERIESSSEATFIYITATSAIVIPKQSISDGNYEEFVQAIRVHLGQSAG